MYIFCFLVIVCFWTSFMIFIVILIVTQNKKHNLYTRFISCSFFNFNVEFC